MFEGLKHKHSYFSHCYFSVKNSKLAEKVSMMKHRLLYTGIQRRMDNNMNVFMPSDTLFCNC